MQQSEREASTIVQTAGIAFGEITTKASSVTNNIQELSSIAEELYARIEEANASTHLMAEITNDAGQQANTVTEIANTNLQSMEDINEASEQLAKRLFDHQ